MDKEKDEKIKAFFENDKIISDKANATFDNFISEIQSKESKTNKDNVVSFEQEKEKSKGKLYNFRKITAVAASLILVFIGSSAYARTQGYDNIFFMIKDMISNQTITSPEEIFSDRDIIISYNSFTVTDNIEMQINELQVKENKAKLYLLVKELNENEDTPFSYKVFNEDDEIMYDSKSAKKESETIYTEVLELYNYKDDTNIIKLEIYNKDKTLVKTVTINLEEKTIEARTENQAVQKISQIELNKFLKQETEKCYSSKELKDKEIIILETYDIYYSDSKYIAKYLFMMPTEEEFENNKVEQSDIYLNTIEFKFTGNEYKTIKKDNPEVFK